MRFPPTYHTLTVDEMRRAKHLHWAEILMLQANAVAKWQVELNDVTKPILEKLCQSSTSA